MERPVDLSNCKRNRNSFFKAILILSVFLYLPIKAWAQPTWVSNPFISDLTALSVNLSFELSGTSNAYIAVYLGDRDYSSEIIKTASGEGVIPARPFVAQLIGISGPQTVYIDNLKPNKEYTIFIVGESGGNLQATPYKIYPVTTPACPTIAPFTALTSLGVCVNSGATKIYNFMNLEPPVNVYKGCEWTIDWGDGSPLYTYTSTANGDVPPNQPHTYTGHDSCYYEITLIATNPGACATVGALQKVETPILAGRDIDTDGNGEMLLVNLDDGSPDTIKVCEGTEAFITLQDAGTWDCDELYKTYPPGEINAGDRNLQFVYGMNHQTQAVENTITGDILITGTYPGTANTSAGHASGIYNIDTDLMATITNPNTNSDVLANTVNICTYI